jgi:acetylornithine aminotransferase
VFKPGDHASTYGGNPLACAAGLAVAAAIDDDNLLENVRDRGEQLRSGLRMIQKEYPDLISDVRGWGLINGAEISDKTELTAAQVVQACIDRGLLLVPAGPKVVRFVPPLIVTHAEVNEALNRFVEALRSLQK